MQTLNLANILQNKFIGTDDLRKSLSDILDRLPNEGGEIIVTQHGKPQAILIDLQSYLDLHETLEDLQRPGFIDSLYEGLQEIKDGKGISHEELMKKLKL